MEITKYTSKRMMGSEKKPHLKYNIFTLVTKPCRETKVVLRESYSLKCSYYKRRMVVINDLSFYLKNIGKKEHKIKASKEVERRK